MPPNAATMSAWPGAWAIARPFTSTVATAGLVLLQVVGSIGIGVAQFRSVLCVEPSDSRRVATKHCAWPGLSAAVAGATVIDVTVASDTVSRTVAAVVWVPSVTVTANAN